MRRSGKSPTSFGNANASSRAVLFALTLWLAGRPRVGRSLVRVMQEVVQREFVGPIPLWT
jgi:hypothetical protein